MKNPFLFVLFALFVALLVCASDVQAGCQQQVLALRQVQLQPVQIYSAQQQQLNSGCYVQQVQQLPHFYGAQQLQAIKVKQVQVQQLNDHHNNSQQFVIIKGDNDGFFEQLREARLQRLKNR